MRLLIFFAAAEDMAIKAGLELRLPGIALKEQRKCSFVEEGSVSYPGAETSLPVTFCGIDMNALQAAGIRW